MVQVIGKILAGFLNFAVELPVPVRAPVWFAKVRKTGRSAKTNTNIQRRIYGIREVYRRGLPVDRSDSGAY